jgi:hypothetical protein
MIVSHRHRFIFVHIPKTGGEAITEALEAILGPDDLCLKSAGDIWRRSLTSRRYRHLDGLQKHARAKQIQESLGEQIWQDYFTFTFVREPAERMLSYYRYLATIDARREQAHPRHLWFYLTAAGRKADPRNWAATEVFRKVDSFSEFLQPPGGQPNRLLAPQVSYTQIRGRPALDFVGHFENLSEDLNQLSSTLGLGPLRLPHRNASVPPAWLLPDRLTVTAADRSFLETHYANDYKAFGYPRIAH